MKPHVHQDDDAHHVHPESRPRPLNVEEAVHGGTPSPLTDLPPVRQGPPPLDEAIHQGAEYWFAREFVAGLMTVAEAMKIPVQDFLADKVFMLSQRLALAESEVEILRHRVVALSQENMELHVKLDDCNCHDEEASAEASQKPFDSRVSLQQSTSTDVTKNGDDSA